MPRLLAALTLALGLGATGCFDGAAPAELHLTDIEVTNEVDTLGGALDMEVHLFDATTHEHLGCSGRDQGMEPVDASDVAYGIDAYFISPTNGARLWPEDLIGHAIEIQVIEDDAEPCPVAPGIDDDVVGITTVSQATLDAGDTIAFEDVVALRVAIE